MRFMKRFCITFLMIYFSLVCAQLPRDSSFTNYSELQKVRKKYPEAQLTVPAVKSSVSLAENVIYTSFPGRKLHLDAYLHESIGKKPAVILIHGGGWKSGNKEMMKPLAMAVANKGFNCFAVEYRLSSEARYPAAVEDVLNAIRFLKENADRFNIDPKKIVVLGTSSGGQMASLIGTKYAGQIAAVINIDGILAFNHPDSEEGSAAAAWLGGTLAEKPEIWTEASPLSHVIEKSAPTLFIASQHKRFQAGRQDMIKMLDKYSIYSQTQIIDNSPHTFWMFDPWFDPVVGYITRFINQQFNAQKIQSK